MSLRLGAILCEILTGQPPYVGETSQTIYKMAYHADLTDAMLRLENSGAEPDLIDLARDCLAADSARRPRDAGYVAAAIAAYQRGVEDRLVTAKQAKLEAQIKAEEEHKRRKIADALTVQERKKSRLALSLAAAVVVAMGMAGFGAFLYWQQVLRDTRLVEVDLARAEQLRDAALAATADHIDLVRWDRAREAADVAKAHVTPLLPTALAARVRSFASAVAIEATAAHDDQALLDALADVRAAKKDPRADAPAEYHRVFADHGVTLGPHTSDAELHAIADRLQQRPGEVVVQLASFLDDWSVVLRSRSRSTDRPLAEMLRALASNIDDDSWRNRLRDTLAQSQVGGRGAALLALASESSNAKLPAPTLTLLASSLREIGESQAAVDLMQKARSAHRSDPWLKQELGLALRAVRPSRHEDALRAFTAAYTLRPEMGFELAMCLRDTGRTTEAIQVLENVINRQRRPSALYWLSLGDLQASCDLKAPAEASYTRSVCLAREWLAGHPDHVATLNNLGNALAELGKLGKAIEVYREVIRLKSDYAPAYANLGNAYYKQRSLSEAVAAYRQAIRLNPDFGNAHAGLGTALAEAGELSGAVTAYREAIRLQPDLSMVHNNLGTALIKLKRPREALVEFQEAIRHKPDNANAHNNLGATLASHFGMPRQALAEFQEAIRLRPTFAEAYNGLGRALRESGEPHKAIEAHQKAISLKPNYAEAYTSMGLALAAVGRLPEAIEAHQKALKIQPGLAAARYNLSLVLQRARLLPQDDVVKNGRNPEKPKEVGKEEKEVTLRGVLGSRLEKLRDGRFVKPPRSNVPTSYLRAVSSEGDYVGEGKIYSYEGSKLIIGRTDRGVQIRADGWEILLGAPPGRSLEVGEYLNAKRYSFSGDAPGIEFTGNGRGCNKIFGNFVVWELEWKGDEVVRLAIDFVQHCEEITPSLYGVLRFNSSFQ